MLIWIIFAVMTGAAVMALLWPLGRGPVGAFADTADAKSLYRAQLSEIDRDVGRKLIGPGEADAARVEAARRLLRMADGQAAPSGETEASLRRRRAASALALSCVPLLTLVLYGAQGSPDQPDQPLAARLQAEPAQQDFALSLARIESHLAANPADARGWTVIAPIYLRQGRYDDAMRAFSFAIRHGGPNGDALAGLGEAQTLAAGGVVTAEARGSFTAAVAADTGNARARFFLAIAKEQEGDAAGAVADLRTLLAQAPSDAPWADAVRQRLVALAPQAPGAEAIATLPEADRAVAIRGMVEALSARLKQDGGSVAEWTRLVRSQMVLGNRDAAVDALSTARTRLAQDGAALAQLDDTARELGLAGAKP